MRIEINKSKDNFWISENEEFLPKQRFLNKIILAENSVFTGNRIKEFLSAAHEIVKNMQFFKYLVMNLARQQ